MTEVPKIVYDRLRAAHLPGRSVPGESVPSGTVPRTAHPDADLLSAFAEQALSGHEREGVLDHLALCGECREVIALALPDAAIGAAPTSPDTEVETTAIPAKSKSRWNWLNSPNLAWPGLRWAALAAVVAVAASVLLLHPGKLNQAMLPSANRQVAPAANPPVAASPVTSSPSTSAPIEQSTMLARTDKPELQMSKKLKAGPAMPPLQVESGMLLAGNGNVGNRDKDSAQADKVPAASGRAGAFDDNASSGQAVTESVEVTGAAEAVIVEPSSPGAQDASQGASPGRSRGTLMAQATAPAIEKAKPAPQETEVFGLQKPDTTAAASDRLQGRNAMSAAKLGPSPNQTLGKQALGKQALTNNVTWTIKEGILQRSQDSGQTWQNALRADHPLLCYAGHDPEIWTGGQAGTLFHSSDNGLTWAQVQPYVKTHPLASDITRIDIHESVDNARGPAEIVLSTSNHELWTSTDGGDTWNKK